MPVGDRDHPPQDYRLLARVSAVLAVLRFYSRLPVPVLRWEANPHAMPDFSRDIWALPIAGAVIGATGAGLGFLALLTGIAPMIAAAITIATLVMITGAFHEDGLADCCDGLFGGATIERRLEIMKDSRIGTFGAAGLVLSLLARVLALGELIRLLGPAAMLLVIGIAACSRPLALIPVVMMPPATRTGLAARVPMPGRIGLAVSILVGLALLFLAAMMVQIDIGAVVAAISAGIAVLLVMRLARQKIGGHTGDVLGACQQVAEIALLIALSAAANWRGPF